MPAVKHPCLQCKEKHVKCDEEQPKCRRCQSKQLPCSRPTRRTVFKHGSVASFAKDQKWVNSEARHFRFHPRGGATATAPRERRHQQHTPPNSGGERVAAARTSPALTDLAADDVRDSPALSPSGSPLDGRPVHHHHQRPGTRGSVPLPPLDRSVTIELAYDLDNGCSDTLPRPATTMPSIAYLTSSPSSHVSPRFHHEHSRTEGSTTTTTRLMSSPRPSSYLQQHGSPASCNSSTFAGPPPPTSSSIIMQPGLLGGDDGSCRPFPLRDVQEACLLRYFIEEMSHWFDLCDEDRHFQLIVPVCARKHPHLLDAIFAVAARHLSRLPQYKTPHGILYHGQLLPNLTEHAAVEYMLKCIPALRQFHDIQDDDYRDSIITTAVILRQLEEIDHEDDAHGGPMHRSVNFLAIIDAVLRSLPSQTAFGQRSLMQAAYWMALRQEIFNSFTRREAPQLMLPPEFWHSASQANKVVMHLVQTAKWHWGGGSEQEWVRLAKQQEHLEQHILINFRPLFQRAADKSRGEIFPTIWYGSNIEVTSVQLGLIAKAVLVAENPSLRNPVASRANWRQVENEVRVLLLDLCGVALCNPASPPALVQAALGIGVYSDFFTDPYERQAIRTVVERYRDTHAWPVQRLLEMFQ
ncbi:fungal zn(2)-Cys(6) binuclear cluster domain-containing protein [Hirsutella rhossiliensis]|uniref:Fungal zn(2)-Cys(6) binuclear cluster domain-containing protein n=1 Tax=Hirsutella rhossiliensis TaxID=111463 RepID=A0A9P8SMJ2_9HYPO|nr:fungal zn(2)-Cys(6) binuclear cluster domain-containing protein [Hirsutella rhossiliensis]KAH0967384.1 fungal zn(2)-Cys(6) binuclear cluster domain-containing protein [Hirsutella rhossiliensis]